VLALRATATRGKGAKLRYALENTNAIVTYLEQYFGVEYPYAKLDLIASPEFGTGGMENAGAIIYGDARLLLADNASLEQRRGFGAIHAHELAHQWFGDLVTPRWWNDIWLNESFASWMGFKAAHAWRPEMQLDVVPLVQALAAMELDSRIAARHIRQPVASNNEIASSFDAITYLKGAGVLAMFESYLGEEAFREGIRTHMRRFEHSVADVEDFMSSLAQGSGRPDVVPAFRSFIDQAGVPIVGVNVDCGGDGATVSLRQSRYLPLGSKGDPAQTWQLPLCLRHGSAQALTKHCTLLTGSEATMPLKAAACPEFVMPNADGAGYYRFALDEDGWRRLMGSFSRLNQKEALAAADSLSAAYQANRLSTDGLIAAARSLTVSPYPQVAMAPDGDLIRLRDELAPPEARAAVTALMRELYRPRLDAIGIAAPAVQPAAADTAAIDTALFRTNLVRFLALEAEDRELRAMLAGQARRYVRMDQEGGGLDEAAVDSALTEIALRAGVQELGAPFAEVLIERLVNSSDAQFRGQAAVALGNTDDIVLGDRLRALVLDERLRAREPTSLAFALAARPSQRRATFDWFRKNHAALTARVSHFAHRWFPRFGAGFCTLRERDEVAAFFTPLVGAWQGADRTLAETLEGIELCAALAEAKREEVSRYFTQR
jgi:alanyl aminopeptidase